MEEAPPSDGYQTKRRKKQKKKTDALNEEEVAPVQKLDLYVDYEKMAKINE